MNPSDNPITNSHAQLPNIAIVGQTNVGKSTLFNALSHRRISIVDDKPGTTRDRVSFFISYDNFLMELVDTGGMLDDQTPVFQSVKKQIEIALSQADILLLVVDVKPGLTWIDQEIAQLLRKQGKPVILVINKVDNPKLNRSKVDFFKLGLGKPLAISALHRKGLKSLLDKIIKITKELGFRTNQTDFKEAPLLKLAIVGKRNVGKSTLVNTMAREERVIVSELPGTTRDSVDVRFEYEGKIFVAIDTAGLRKKSKLKKSVEIYSYNKTKSAIKRADVSLFLIDAQEKLSEVDKKITRFIVDTGKPCIIVINKWDLAKEKTGTENYSRYINKMLPGLKFAPISFISAKSAFNVWPTILLTIDLINQAKTRVPTPAINQALQKIKARTSPSSRTSKLPKIYYGTQVAILPPQIVIFVNDPELFSPTYKRYLLNRFREELPFSEVPLRIDLKKRSRDQLVENSA